MRLGASPRCPGCGPQPLQAPTVPSSASTRGPFAVFRETLESGKPPLLDARTRHLTEARRAQCSRARCGSRPSCRTISSECRQNCTAIAGFVLAFAAREWLPAPCSGVPLKRLRKIPYELHRQESPEITGDSVEFSTRSKTPKSENDVFVVLGGLQPKGSPL